MSNPSFDHTFIGSVSPDDDPSTSPELRSGEMLEKFEIIRELGRGGMGAVYLARDPTLDRSVAIKVLSKTFSRDESALKRFLAEARAAGQLNHPNVVGVYEVGQRKCGDYYIAMEYLPNGAVADKLQPQTACDPVWSTAVILDAARGLAAAHRVGLIHRDIKPANLMIGDNGVTKVGDFGLVRSQKLEDAQMTQAGQIMGTPYFMSPEQCVGREVDGRSDLYSLGATYYTLLAGSSPFADTHSTMEIIVAHVNHAAPDLLSVNPKVPAVCGRIAARALQKAPEQRYQSATELITDLEATLAVLQDETAKMTVNYRGTRSSRLDLFELPSEGGGRHGNEDTNSGKSSLFSRFIGRGSKDSSGNVLKTHPSVQTLSTRPSVATNHSVKESAQPHAESTGAPHVQPADVSVREDVFSLSNGSVAVSWPAELLEDDLPHVEQWLALVIEKMKRAARETTEKPESSASD